MSAMNVMVKCDSVHLVTDGAVYGADGKLLLISPKAASLPHLRAAIGVRGPAGAVPLLAAWLSASAQTFDGLIESAPKTLRELKPILDASFRHCVFGFDFDVVICGISEINGPAAYVISSVDRPDVPAWEAVQLRGLSLAPAEPAMTRQIFATIPGFIEDLDPEVDGLKILQCQRAHAFDPGGGRKFVGVGGFGQLTSIARDGVISTKIICRWPDVISEPINADAIKGCFDLVRAA